MRNVKTTNLVIAVIAIKGSRSSPEATTGRRSARGRKSLTIPCCSVSCWFGSRTAECAAPSWATWQYPTSIRRVLKGFTHRRQGAGAIFALSVGVVWTLCGLVGCTPTTPVKPYVGSAPRAEPIYVVSGGWHTELGLPLEGLTGGLAALKPEFPSARYLVFGWGARDYYTARNAGIADLLRAAVPGPAVMLVIPLQISPEAFFGASNVFVLSAPREGIQRLAQFLWDYLAVDKHGLPSRISIGPYPQSVFYASTGTYNLGHTCNTWTAEALQVAGLPINAAGVVFAGQVLDQLPSVVGNDSQRIRTER